MIFYSSLQPEGIDYIIPFFGCSILTHSRANEGNVRISVDICLRSSYIFQTGMFKIWKQCHWGFLNYLQRIWKLNLLSEMAIPEILRVNHNAVCALPSFSEFEVRCPHVLKWLGAHTSQAWNQFDHPVAQVFQRGWWKSWFQREHLARLEHSGSQLRRFEWLVVLVAG